LAAGVIGRFIGLSGLLITEFAITTEQIRRRDSRTNGAVLAVGVGILNGGLPFVCKRVEGRLTAACALPVHNRRAAEAGPYLKTS
jgi:hypothetical protein